MKKIFYVFMILLFFSSDLYSMEERSLLEKSGFSSYPIEDAKVAVAKKEALNRAIAAAYQSAILSIIPEKFISPAFEKISGVLETDPSFSVEEFHVTGELSLDTRCLVSVKASFNRKLIEEKLTSVGVILEKIKLPKTILLISQKDIEDFVPYQWWKQKETPEYSSIEKRISQELINLGYPIVEPFVVERDEQDVFEMDDVLDKKEAINIALEQKADLVIVGKAGAVPGGNRFGKKETVKVSVSLVAFKTDSGEEILSISNDSIATTEKGMEFTESAFEKGGREAGREIGKKVYSYWKELLESREEIEIEISGDNYLPRFIRFKTILKETGVVEDLREKEITSQGSIVVAVFKGSAKEFASKIVEIPFQGFGIEISDVSDNKMKINFISNH